MDKIKPTIYIETTIPNFFFDFKNQSTEKKVDTVFFWENNLRNFEPMISLAVMRELIAVPNYEWRKQLIDFVQDLKTIEISQEMVSLAEKYILAGLVPQSYSADAVHLAVATIHRIDYLLTWNIQHLAHPIRRKAFRDYNVENNFFVVEIVTPKELNYQINQS